jgi:histidinol-phosphate aminotransferase
MQNGVIVRPVANYGLPDWLRVSVGLPHENDLFFEKLREIRSETPKAAVA